MPAPDDNMHQRESRRRFLESSAGLAAGLMAFGATAQAKRPSVNVGVIGVRVRGRQLARAFSRTSGCRVVAICDVDPTQAIRTGSELLEFQQQPCRQEAQASRVLGADDVDAVVIATPDHWHASLCLQAIEAGKHVFVETPMSHTVAETRSILSAARASDRVVFCGLQQRSMPHVQSALRVLQEGRLGNVRLARAWSSHKRKPIGRATAGPVPIGVDYETWLGPAPRREFTPNRFHYSWRWFWDYGGGELTNLGVHMIDIARLGLNVTTPRRIVATGGQYYTDDDQETPDTLTVNYDFHDCSLIWEHRQWCSRPIEGRSTGVAFYGDRGTLIIDRGGWKIYDSDKKDASGEQGSGDSVVADFLTAVRLGRPDHSLLESAAISTDLCHFGNLAWRSGHEIRLDEPIADASLPTT